LDKVITKGLIAMANRLIDVLNNPEQITSMPKTEISHLLGELEAIKAQLWYRLAQPVESIAGYKSQSTTKLLTVEEASEKLAFKPSYLYELIRQGHFPAFRQGKYIRIRSYELDEWIRQQQ
jgi:excisionase family DNA binding protein